MWLNGTVVDNLEKMLKIWTEYLNLYVEILPRTMASIRDIRKDSTRWAEGETWNSEILPSSIRVKYEKAMKEAQRNCGYEI
jgi:hypothetical protein